MRNKYEVDNKMTWTELICGSCLMLLLFVIVPSIAGHIQTNYTRKDCIVTYVANDEIAVKDKSGHIWSFYADNSNLKVNDIITIKMHTNFTDNIIDDDYVVGIK